ncbi:unnamed protein product [Rotaria sordida]|uniref:Uncharacterized protein n=1 Tax=Rotaria sordida TaxID=392033 RepID=A0A818NRY9_9BILA|nr:unnamed protein product [Rotaria sordida]CAF0838809.1 unnamed protein product [Rotaria sordida]CAF3612125.1 unnamed protein product [Rotaria sordida]CAF3728997.1 unnamed protein product [Rotaria sordida]
MLRKLNIKRKISLQLPVIRRAIRHLFTIIVITYIIFGVYYYYEDYININDSIDSIARYNTYIDIKGNLIPISGYKILQSVASPSLQKIHELFTYLDKYNELKDYFILVFEQFYHVTFTKLINTTTLDEKQLEILEKEQDLLDKKQSQTICIGKKLLFIEKNEIRLEIEFKHDYINDYMKSCQKRWNENFPELIIQHCTSFYITLAYQYKEIPNQEILNRTKEILEQWHDVPFEIELDSIEICSYSSLITYEPIFAESKK